MVASPAAIRFRRYEMLRSPAKAMWSGHGYSLGGGPWTYGSGQRNTVYIVDVDGIRQVIGYDDLPGTSAANLGELEQILASIRFEP